MNKLLVTGAIMAVMGFSSQAVSTEAQIDALQNEILKIKQEMASDKSKAYFKKGKGLSIKSSDGKYSFQIKGRLMYDFSAITAGNDTVDNPSRADNIGTFGNEFRRARFSIKGEVGDGWGFAFQPDFAETVSDNVSGSTSGPKGVDVKDALIYKKIKGFGKLSIGNVKSAGGLWENTSSNSILFMERPMYNEAANLAHRAGIHYDTAGAFGKKFPLHLKATLGVGAEGAWRQEQEDSDTFEDNYVTSVAAHYTHVMGKKHYAMFGGSYTYENHSDLKGRSVEARAQGVHTLGEKILDTNLANIESYSYGGPQFAYSNGPLFTAGEYYYVNASRVTDSADDLKTYDDYNANGASIFAHYFLTGGAHVALKPAKGSISGVKCKARMGCTAAKVMFEFANFASDEASENATDAKVIHFGINHYFNSNVRLMIDAARGLYQGGTGMSTDAKGTNVTHSMTSVQTRLHLKW
mgnify:FL=1